MKKKENLNFLIFFFLLPQFPFLYLATSMQRIQFLLDVAVF